MSVLISPRATSVCACGVSHAFSISRRRLLKAGAALALGGAVASHTGFIAEAAAQAAPQRIDVHHHLVAPNYLDAVTKINRDNVPMHKWTIQDSLADMDKGGVGIAMLSVASPQCYGLDAATAAKVSRESNELSKKYEADYPGRFGTWAMLPLPFIDESLKEIAYAFDVLKVDGIGVLTSYGDKWLGYAEFEPVWAELNRRKATVYTHPAAANCCHDLVRGIDDAFIEYGTDTARALFTIIYGGFAEKYPDINWIWSHGGGTLTALSERFLVQPMLRPTYKGKFTTEQVQAQLNRFYYDTAQIANKVTLSAVVQLIPVSQLLYGTDYPYRVAIDETRGLNAFFKGGDLEAVDHGNAMRLIPRLRRA